MPTSQVRVYIASSIDGFIAGPDDDLSWLPEEDPEGSDPSANAPPDPGALGYEDFISGIGALLMGRRTYDVVQAFDVPWPYGEKPVLVATRRPLDPAPPPTVRGVQGSISELIAIAREAAGEGDIYLDGGELIRQAAEANLIDDLTITLAPIALGRGYPPICWNGGGVPAGDPVSPLRGRGNGADPGPSEALRGIGESEPGGTHAGNPRIPGARSGYG